MRRGKYNAKRTNGFASKKESITAAMLQAIERAGGISELEFQVPVVIAEGRGKYPRGIKYIADFKFRDKRGNVVHMDAKGYRTKEYKLKRALLYLLHGIEIEEV